MAASSKYLVRNLWNAAPVLTTNLVDIGLVDTAFNSTLTRAAVKAFDEYTSIRRGSALPRHFRLEYRSTVGDGNDNGNDNGNGDNANNESNTKPSTRRRRRTSSSRLERNSMESPTSGLIGRPNPTFLNANANGDDDGSEGNNNSSSSSSSSSNGNHNCPVTDNDFFFQHQKNRGYRLATEAIAGCDCARRLQDDHLVATVAYYLQHVCGAKPLADVLRSGTGEVFIDMWAAVQRGKGAYHADHVHEGALVSGVYYASVPTGSAPLVLRRPTSRANNDNESHPIMMGGGGGGGSADDEDQDQDQDVILPPTEGNLVLFPPWVEHGVPLAEEQQEHDDDDSSSSPPSRNHLPRVSFAFNVTSSVVLGNDPWSVTRIQ